MALRTNLIGAIASALLATGPACAQEVTTKDGVDASVDQTEAVNAEAPSGFRLLEHGAWQRMHDAVPGTATDSDASRVYLPYHHSQAGRGGPSGFRRATPRRSG